MTPYTRNDAERAIEPYITGRATSCSYCAHLTPLIVSESDHTYITQAIGQIIDGYLQIAPRIHRVSASSMSTDELASFIKHASNVRGMFKKLYDTTGIAFEHGRVGACMFRENEKYVEQLHDLCHHAHVHFIPTAVDIRAQIDAVVPDSIRIESVADLRELRMTILQREEYLYYQDPSGNQYVYPVEGIPLPPQFLRRVLANALGCPERTSWRDVPGMEHFEANQARFLPLVDTLPRAT